MAVRIELARVKETREGGEGRGLSTREIEEVNGYGESKNGLRWMLV
jgi:hypothetical protein